MPHNSWSLLHYSSQYCYFVYLARMSPVRITLPSFLFKNAFQACKQFLAWIAERTGRLRMIREAPQLVSSSLFSNVKLPTHPELGGWKARRCVTPVLCLRFD